MPCRATEQRLTYRFCRARNGADTHYLDRATVTAASGAERTLLIVRQRAGAGVVWVKPMYQDLGLAARSGSPAWTTAQEQLKRLGARLCTLAEKRLLARPGVGPTKRDVLVVDISGACQWLRSVGEQAAARQLEQHQQAQPSQPAAILSSSSAAERDGAASLMPLQMPAIPNPHSTAQPVVGHVVPQLQADWRVASRRGSRACLTFINA